MPLMPQVYVIFHFPVLSLKVLQAPSGIERKEVATLTAELKVRENPQKKHISVFRLDSRGKVVEKLAFNVTGIIAIKAMKYRFEMLVLFNATSNYILTYQFLNYNIRSNPFRIHIYGKVYFSIF